MWYFIKAVGFFLLLFILGGCGSKQSVVYAPPQSSIHSKSSHPNKATMKPYQVNGKTYHPTVVGVGSRYQGIASWYGPNFHGKRTSSGEFYNMYDFTAAHKTLPMNTIVKVTNLKNGRTAIVRINDRGPFVEDRIIDLSYAAAKQLDMIKMGTAPVELEVLGFGSTIETLSSQSQKEMVLGDFAVQIGSFRRYEGAKITQEKNALVQGRYKAIIKKMIIEGEPLYRVWLTGFKSEAEARDFIKQGRYVGAFVIRK